MILPPQQQRPPPKFLKKPQHLQQPRAQPPPQWTDEQLARVRSRSYLGPRGYTIRADALVDDAERAALRSLARFQPQATDPTRPAPQSVVMAVESDTKWFLPQAQGLAVFGAPARNALPYRAPPRLRPLRLAQDLFAKQLPIVSKCVRELSAQYSRNNGYAGIVIQAGCGEGKTVMAIFLSQVAHALIAAGKPLTDAMLDNANLMLDDADREAIAEAKAAEIHRRAVAAAAAAAAAADPSSKKKKRKSSSSATTTGAPSAKRRRRRRLKNDDEMDEEEEEGEGETTTEEWDRQRPMPGAVLVLVNKGFLSSQWEKRIWTACPGARIGRIQGKVYRVRGCHFVLGMVQTMWRKTYDPAAFAAFQTVIVDEAHGICSLKFFQALRQVVAPFVIALSATVQKPNGMEEVLFRFVGPIAYRSPIVPTRYRVTVRVVQYARHEDPEYSRLDYNREGDLDFTTTSVRVANYPPRLNAAADTLLRFACDNPKTQILVLCSYKEPLHELAKRIKAWNAAHRGGGSDDDDDATDDGGGGGGGSDDDDDDDDPAAVHCPTFGFYIGGMKPEELDVSAEQQIILATYSMAAEALDIPNLDAVFMYNSKATITQSIGRAMRIMNNNKFIYDFADAHQVFQSQLFRKRMPVYRSFGYQVFKTTYNELAASPEGSSHADAAAGAVWHGAAARAGGRGSSSSSAFGGDDDGGGDNEAACCCAFDD